jgi:hypothetical protein
MLKTLILLTPRDERTKFEKERYDKRQRSHDRALQDGANRVKGESIAWPGQGGQQRPFHP